MWYLPEFESEPRTEFEFVEDGIPTLACLNVSVATAVTCLRNNGTDKVGGHCPEIDHDSFAFFIPKTFDQIAGTITCLHNFGVIPSFHCLL